MQAGSLSLDVPPTTAQQSHPMGAAATDSNRQSGSSHEVAAMPALAVAQPAKNSLMKHINFSHEDELKTAHPEVKVCQILSDLMVGCTASKVLQY